MSYGIKTVAAQEWNQLIANHPSIKLDYNFGTESIPIISQYFISLPFFTTTLIIQLFIYIFIIYFQLKKGNQELF